MVTKKSRRKQIAQASTQRQADRRQRHESHSKLLHVVAAALVAVLAVVALVLWIVLHDSGSAATRTARVDYDAVSVDRTQPRNIEVTR